jgi:hypothetical protein
LRIRIVSWRITEVRMIDDTVRAPALLAAREPPDYRRYDRWWAHFAGLETRLLPGR